MAKLLHLNHFPSEKGDLTVIENLLPNGIKRVYYISNVPNRIVRGGHRHHKTWQFLVNIKGSCRIFVDDNTTQEYYLLDNPEIGLLLEPKDWHTMDLFDENTILLVLANEPYDVNDYIDEPYH